SGACTIAPTDVNKEVQLGNIAAVNLDAAGKKGPLNSFELKLQDCQLDPSASGTPYSKVKITFNGQPDATNASLWSSTGSANNVAVSFLDSTGKTIKPGETLEQTLKASDTTIILSAQAEATGAATSGSINSIANYVLSYE
ncbi:fimbrial protein, partial [Providencia hangzhouensis]